MQILLKIGILLEVRRFLCKYRAIRDLIGAMNHNHNNLGYREPSRLQVILLACRSTCIRPREGGQEHAPCFSS